MASLTESTFSPGSQRLSKQWPQRFSNERKPLESEPWLKKLSALSNRYDGIELFMRRYDDDKTPPHVESVIDYCRGFGESDFRDTGMMVQGNAWLDDRAAPIPADARGATASDVIPTRQRNVECDTIDAHGRHPSSFTQSTALSARSYDESLTAWDLRRHLHVRRFNHDRLQDADRRLIHIADPTQCHMLALIETATEHQAPAIQDLLGQYLTFKTSMKVTISTEGYHVFQLEQHFPYFGLHMTKPEDNGKLESRKLGRKMLMDISFLDPRNEPGTCGFYQARSSFTLSGSDNMRWIAYGLEDTSFSPDREIGEDECNDFRRSDQISMGKFDANLPFHDAREYFLAISLIRAKHAQKEMQSLTGRIDASCRHYITCRPFSTASATEQAAISKWNERMLELLAVLIQDLKKKVYCLDSFRYKDLEYFNDPNATLPPRVIEHIARTINELDNVHEELKSYEQTLSRIQEVCEKLATRLEFRLSLQGGKIGEFTVIIISPVVIVSSIFAIPKPVLPYGQSSLSFFLTVTAVMILLWALLLLKGGWLAQQAWWEKLWRRGRTLSRRRDSSIIAVNQGELSVLRRGNTRVNSTRDRE
jgi:hypothetical protein